MESAGNVLVALDRIILGIFVIELAIRIAAYGRGFFRGGFPLSSSGEVVKDLAGVCRCKLRGGRGSTPLGG